MAEPVIDPTLTPAETEVTVTTTTVDSPSPPTVISPQDTANADGSVSGNFQPDADGKVVNTVPDEDGKIQNTLPSA